MQLLIGKYVEQGFKIFPCNADKTPATPQGFKNAHSDLNILYKQFYRDDMLIGLPTGNVNGIVVVDIDLKDGRSLNEVIEDLKEYGDFPETLQVQTMSGGIHLYYTITETEISSHTHFFHKNLPVDIRGNGGYVITADYRKYFPLDVDDIDDMKSHMVPLPDWIEKYRKSIIETPATEGLMLPESEVREIRSALAYLDADDRDTWVRVGMCLKSTGTVQAKGLWTEWSMKSPKFDAKDQEAKWKTFKPSDITIASLFALAKSHGWVTTYESDKTIPPSGTLPQPNIIIPAWIKEDFGLNITKELLAELEKMPPPEAGGHCKFLNLDFPKYGCVMITARTGKGKSTSLANCIRELLQQGKSILFLSFEEPFQLALSRLAQSFGYEIAFNEGITCNEFPQDSWLGRFNAFHAEDRWIRQGADIVKKYIYEGQLRIIDSSIADNPREAKYFYQTLSLNQGNHIIALDYIQLLNIGKSRNFEIWGHIAGNIIESMNSGKTLLIAAAQLNRLGSESSNGGFNYDPSAEQLRESASLEQLASFIIGGGEQDGVKFFKLMKDRFSQIGAGKYLINNTPHEWMGKNFLLPNGSNWSTEKALSANPLKGNIKKIKSKSNQSPPWEAEI